MLMGGRLTLQSGSPVQTADQLDKDTIYYAPLIGGEGTVQVYDGSAMQTRSFVSSDSDQIGLSTVIDSNVAHTGYCAAWCVYDLYVYWNGTNTVLGYGPKWTQPVAPTSVSRGTGAGTTEIEYFKRLWVNKNSITLRFGNASGNTTTVAARQATLVGSFCTQDNVKCDMALKPAPYTGGTQNLLSISNAYNRVPLKALNRDLTTSWTYSGAGVRNANNSARNRIWWMDCLGISDASARFSATVVPTGTAANAYTCGVGFEQASQLYGCTLNQAAFINSTAQGTTVVGWDNSYGIMGLRWVQALEQSTTAGMQVYANGFTALELETMM